MILDLIIFSLYLYIIYNHIIWHSAQNEGMGYEIALQKEPSPELMYNEEFNKNEASSPINIRFFSTWIAMFGFLRCILSLIVTETFGPIIITIIFMFDDIKRFLTIWAIVVVSFAAFFL